LFWFLGRAARERRALKMLRASGSLRSILIAAFDLSHVHAIHVNSALFLPQVSLSFCFENLLGAGRQRETRTRSCKCFLCLLVRRQFAKKVCQVQFLRCGKLLSVFKPPPRALCFSPRSLRRGLIHGDRQRPGHSSNLPRCGACVLHPHCVRSLCSVHLYIPITHAPLLELGSRPHIWHGRSLPPG